MASSMSFTRAVQRSGATQGGGTFVQATQGAGTFAAALALV